MPLIFDLVDPQMLVGFARTLQSEIENNEHRLSQFLPSETQEGITFELAKGTIRDEAAAPIRAWDTPAPIGGRKGVEKKIGELAPFAKKWDLGEELSLRMRELLRGNNDATIRQIFDDTAKAVRAVLNRFELMRGEALYSGQIVFNENGIQQTVDFGRDSDMEVNADTVWTNHDDSDPIAELQGWITDYQDFNNGLTPAAILTSRKVVANLLMNASVRTLTATVSGAPARVSRAALNNVLDAYEIPPIITYDTLVPNVAGTPTRPIPDDRLILMPPPGRLGRTAFGPTAEAAELVSAGQISVDQVSGVTVVIDKTTDPVATWTKASATGMAILAEPDLAMVADVL